MNNRRFQIVVWTYLTLIMIFSSSFQKSSVLFQENADSIDHYNHYNNIKSQDHITKEDFINFNSVENIDRIFDWSDYINSNGSYIAPSDYNSTSSKIKVKVINSSVQEAIFQDSILGGKSRAEQAQSFILSEDLLLLNLSIYVNGLKDYNAYMEIRNNTHDGSSILSFYYDLNSDGWINITFEENPFLNAGTYFLYMAYNTAPNTRGWYRSNDGENSTETWIKNGDMWETPDWDLTLKVYTSERISPESVEMEVNGQSVINLDLSSGYVELSHNITGAEVYLNVTSNSSISYSFQINASYQRFNTINYNYSFNMNIPNFILIPDLHNPGMYYENYTVNVSKIMDDYYDVQVFYNNTVKSFSFTPYDSIVFNGIADLIVFKSPNYIFDAELTQTIYSGSYGNINISTLLPGNLSLEILDENGSIVYENLTFSDGFEEFYWDVNPDLHSGKYNATIYYFGDNEIGFFESQLVLVKDASLVSQTITAKVLDNVSLECRYFDNHLNTAIEGSTISYEMHGLTGDLAFDSTKDGNYTSILDLSIYSLKPGQYEIVYSAEKEGYRELSSYNQINLIKRSISIELSKSTSAALPGESIIFRIDIEDDDETREIERPIDFSFKIVKSIENSSEEIIVSTTLLGVTTIAEYVWEIPKNLVEGQYDVIIEAENDFYSGTFTQSGAILIKVQPTSLGWLYSIVSIAAVALISSFYIFTERERTRRSIYGIMLLHESGIPIVEKFSKSITKYEPMLFSSAIAGVITLIKEITGEKLHILRIEGGRMNFIKGEHSYLVIFLRKNPIFVRDIMADCNADIIEKHGEQIAKFKGIFFDIDIEHFVQKHFKTSIDMEEIRKVPENRDFDTNM